MNTQDNALLGPPLSAKLTADSTLVGYRGTVVQNGSFLARSAAATLLISPRCEDLGSVLMK